jgi:16S rRNA (cytosine967-C5)-methyltransferase
MSRDLVRLRNLTQLIEAYSGKQPLHLFLQEQFRMNKSWGSSDRRFYREWVYSYMRLGNAATSISVPEALMINALRKKELALLETWCQQDESRIKHIRELESLIAQQDWFPRQNLVSSQIDLNGFRAHHESVLPVYARILPKAEKGTMNLPNGALLLPDGALSIPPATDLTEWLEKGFLQVQDLGSQIVCKIISRYLSDGVCWDACCGAGGKSLYYAELVQDGNLLCSDIRPSILENLNTRFAAAGYTIPYTAVVDLEQKHSQLTFHKKTDSIFLLEENSVDALALDVPCSGSGTWGRNPEMLQSRFHRADPESYSVQQRSIAAHALSFLKPGGKFFYSTCSVYSCENEDNVSYFRDSLGLNLLESSYIDGYHLHCDYLYLAVFEKNA